MVEIIDIKFEVGVIISCSLKIVEIFKKNSQLITEGIIITPLCDGEGLDLRHQVTVEDQ